MVEKTQTITTGKYGIDCRLWEILSVNIQVHEFWDICYGDD